MGALGPGKRRGKSHRSGIGRRHQDLHALMAQQMHAGAPMHSPTPVRPEKRLVSDNQRMQQETHLTRLGGGTAIPLALLAQRAGTTTGETGAVDHPQISVCFSAVFMGVKRFASRTAKGPIRLKRKIGSREAPGFPGRSGSGWAVARGRRGRG